MHDSNDDPSVTLEQLFLDRMDQFEAKMDLIEERLLAAIKTHLDQIGPNSRYREIETPAIATDGITPSNAEQRLADWIHPAHLKHLIAMDRKLINKIQFKSVPGCWIWTGTKAANGSPSVQINDRKDGRLKRKLARRWFFEQFFPDVLCDERLAGMPECNENLCVNPFHAASQDWFDTLIKKYDVDRYALPFVIDASTAYNPRDPYKTIVNPGIPERPAPPPPQRTVLQRLQELNPDFGSASPVHSQDPPAAPIEEKTEPHGMNPDWDMLMDLNEDK